MKNMVTKSWLATLTALVSFVPMSAFADGAEAAASGKLGTWAAFGALMGLGIAVFGAAGAQGKIASAFMEGISRNPGAEKAMSTPLTLSLVFVETLVIFTVGMVAWLITKM